MSVPSSTSSAKVWIQAVRAFSFTASVSPVLLGSALAYWNQEVGTVTVTWWLLPVIVLAAVAYHAGTNLMSDYFDFVRGVDTPETKGSSGVLVNQLLQPRSVLRAGFLLFGVGAMLGVLFIALRGWTALVYGLIGFVGGYLYCGGPRGYKYFALGDLLVGLLMGPTMVLGTYFVLTGEVADWRVFVVAVPLGLMVTSILHANNMRDILDDGKAGTFTVAGLIGFEPSKIYYTLLLTISYIAVIAFAVFGYLPWGAVLVLISLKPAMENLKMVRSSTAPTDPVIAMADVRSAQAHFAFGVTLALGIIASAIAGLL